MSTEPQLPTYRKLRRRLQRFVDGIVEGKTGVDAVLAIGFKGTRPDVAASKLRAQPNIRAAIKERTDFAIAAEIDRFAAVARHAGDISTLDPRKIFNADGSLKPPAEWPDEVASAIASVKTEDVYEWRGQGDERTREHVGYRYEVKFWSKTESQRFLAQLHGKLVDRRELTGANGGPIRTDTTNTVTITDPIEAARAYQELMG